MPHRGDAPIEGVARLRGRDLAGKLRRRTTCGVCIRLDSCSARHPCERARRGAGRAGCARRIAFEPVHILRRGLPAICAVRRLQPVHPGARRGPRKRRRGVEPRRRPGRRRERVLLRSRLGRLPLAVAPAREQRDDPADLPRPPLSDGPLVPDELGIGLAPGSGAVPRTLRRRARPHRRRDPVGIAGLGALGDSAQPRQSDGPPRDDLVRASLHAGRRRRQLAGGRRLRRSVGVTRLSFLTVP